MSYTAKHWTNPVNISADNMNELELGVQEAHEGIDRLEKIIPGLQSENNDILKELEKVTSGTSDAFNLLKDIQNTLESEPDLAEILKQNSENFLLKTSQPLTNIEKQQVLKNLGLNKYTFLEDIIVNGNQITNGILDLKIPGIDTELNRNSQNAVANYAIVKALETFGTPDLNRYMNIHNESTTAHSDIRELINSKASMSYVEEALKNIPVPDVSGQISDHNLDSSAHQDIRNLIKNIDLSGYALANHNHDGIYAPIHNHPYAAEDHTHNYATPEYVDNKINTIDIPNVSTEIHYHNTSDTAHQDIRDLINSIDLSGYAPLTHSHNYSYYQRDTIDLSDTSIYDENKYYPCTSKIPVNGLYKLQVAVQLNSGTKPSWSTHDSGFTYNLSALLKANDWGVTNGTMIIFEDTYSHSSVKPGSLTQLTNSGNAVLWLRGGGKYFVFKEWGENWSIHTETTDIYSQTIAPTETLPASQGEKVSYEGHTHNYAPISHTHDYAPTSHTHDYSEVYAAKSHTHDYAASNHTHDYATPSYVDTAIANLVGAAPDTLNTFEELAAALNNNKDILDTFALKTHNHDSVYAAKSHTHTEYAKISGGNTFTGAQHIKGTAASKPLWVRGIQGCLEDGVTEGELHLNYQSNSPVKWGYNANGQLNSDGTITEAGTLLSAKYAPISHTHSYLPLSGGTLTGNLAMSNCNITGVNNIQIADQGAGEGIEWLGGNGWKIYESSNNLDNTTGNLQFVTGSTRRMTIDTNGIVEATVFLGRLRGIDTRNEAQSPSQYMSNNGITEYQEFKLASAIGSPNSNGNGFVYAKTFVPWADPSGGLPTQLSVGNGLAYRTATSETAWGSWYHVPQVLKGTSSTQSSNTTSVKTLRFGLSGSTLYIWTS